MIVWGTGRNIINLGRLESRRCDTCERERPFNLILQYRYFGLYWVFNMVTERKYMLLCDICSRGWELNIKEVQKSLKRVPIPFMHRYGCLLLAAVPIGLVLLAWIIEAFGL